MSVGDWASLLVSQFFLSRSSSGAAGAQIQMGSYPQGVLPDPKTGKYGGNSNGNTYLWNVG